MIVLSNCLTDIVDEGCRKVVVSLVRRIKAAAPETLVVSYDSASTLSDRHIRINKLMLSRELMQLVKQRKEALLYLPEPAKMRSTAVRLFVMSHYARWGLRVVLPMEFPVDALSRCLIRASGAEVIALSESAYCAYCSNFGAQARRLYVGVDARRFAPVDAAAKMALRQKYGLPQNKPIVLHVGHLKAGRGIGCLTDISENFHVVLTVSTQTAVERDAQLRRRLEARPNITIFDTYLPNVEEIYQLSDVYLFPVEQAGNCIDVPLSALEAAACGIPVAATPYGELRELLKEEGFYRINSFEPTALNELLSDIYKEGRNPRQSVLKYNWSLAVAQLLPGSADIEGEDEYDEA